MIAAVSDSFAARIVVLLLASLVLVQGFIASAMLLGPGRNSLAYTLPLPNQIVAIVEAVEHAPPEDRERIVAALNSPLMNVQMLPDIPPRQASERPSPLLEALLRDYTSTLEDREFRIDTKRFDGLRTRLQRDDSGALHSRGPVRMNVRLADGSALQFVPSRSATLATTSARIAGVAAICGVVIVIAFLIAIRQTSLPVKRIADSARRVARDLDLPDLPESGPREVRELSAAFNEMKHTIRDLMSERTRMLAAIAHDLRTYLTRLRLRVDFIDDPEQNQRAGRDLDEMAQLLDDTLLFALETTSRNSSTERTNIAEALPEIYAARQQAGVDVQLQEPVPEATVALARATLGRIVDNLIDNALRYGVRARVHSKRLGNEIQIAVDDDGPGIPEHEIARCLRPFERMEESRHRSTGGTGLGLAIVQNLVDKAGGRIDIENRPEGGLRCTVALPIIP